MAKSTRKKSSKKTSAKSKKAPVMSKVTADSKKAGKKKNWEQRDADKIANKELGVITTRKLLKQTIKILKDNFLVFLILIIIYGVLHFILVQGPVDLSIGEIKNNVASFLPEQRNNTALIAGVLVSESAGVGEAAALYGAFLILIFSLATIWLVRMMYEGKRVRVRDGFYKGMYGLVPVLLVGVVMLIQLVPAAIGGLIYSVATLNGIITNGFEQALFLAIFAGFIALSLYFITSSIIAFYVAALPDVAPMEALRAARSVVAGRRAKVFMRLLFGSIIFTILSFGLLLLSIAVLPGSAVWVWWVISIITVPIVNAYLYGLYRSLL